MEAIKFSFGELKLTNEVINRIADLGYTPESLKEAIKAHEQTNGSESPALYCGTYVKYNAGNFRGMWVDISTFDSYDDFLSFCKAIHADEADPELMYKYHKNIHYALYRESMGEKVFNNIKKYCELCEEYDVFAVYDFLELFMPEDLDRMGDAYVGVYDSRDDFAKEEAIENFNPEKIMGDFADYFDYEAYARDLFLNDYKYGSHGTVFRAF